MATKIDPFDADYEDIVDESPERERSLSPEEDDGPKPDMRTLLGPKPNERKVYETSQPDRPAFRQTGGYRGSNPRPKWHQTHRGSPRHHQERERSPDRHHHHRSRSRSRSRRRSSSPALEKTVLEMKDELKEMRRTAASQAADIQLLKGAVTALSGHQQQMAWPQLYQHPHPSMYSASRP